MKKAPAHNVRRLFRWYDGGSEFQDGACGQHARTMHAVAGGDLGGDLFQSPGFGMRDQDLGTALQELQFFQQQAGAQVLGEQGQFAVAVGEGGLDDEIAQLRDAIDRFPQRRADTGVAAEGQRCAAGMIANRVSDRWHRMGCRQRRDAALADLHRLAQLKGGKAQESSLGRGDDAEVGPDVPVEDVLADDLQGGRRGVHGQGRAAHVAHAVDHQRQAGDVIQVRMRDEDVIDLRQPRQRQVAYAGAGVDQDIVIDEQGSGAHAIATDAPAAAQNFYTHCDCRS